MSWEQRRGHPYYYRARRENGRVVKEYLGAGRAAVTAAAEDQERRRRRQDAQTRERQLLAQVEDLASCLEPFWQASEGLLARALAAAGYHCHRGEWRRRRATSREP